MRQGFSAGFPRWRFVYYTPWGARDSGNLETGTKVVTATSEPSTPDYSVSFDIPASPDPAIEVRAQALRLLVNIVSFGGTPPATTLYASVRRALEGNLLIASWAATGNQIGHATLTSALAFGPQTYEIRLWVNQGNASVDLVRLWKAVGNTELSGPGREVIRLHCRGFYLPMMRVTKVGTAGGYQAQIYQALNGDTLDCNLEYAWYDPNGWLRAESPLLSADRPGYVSVHLSWGVSGDLGVLEQFGAIIEQ